MHAIRHFFNIALLVIATTVSVVFCVANREPVSLSFFPLSYTAQMPVFLLAVLCVAFGMILAGLVMAIAHARTKCRLRAEKLRAAAMQNELSALRMQQDERLSALPTLP